MKKGFKIGLVTICSAILLTACNGGKKELGNDVSETYAAIENTDTASEVKDTENSEINSSEEIDYNWYQGKWYRGTMNTNNTFHIKDGYVCTLHTLNCLLDEMSVEEIDNKDVGHGLRYFYQKEITNVNGETFTDCLILEYYPSVDRVIITQMGNLYKEQYNCSDVYEYDPTLSEGIDTQNDSHNEEYVYPLFDGQRFECFETVSGEDVILTVHLFYSDNSDTPSAYKGELSTGVEFWFVPHESSEDYVTYKIDCTDGTTAYMRYSVYSSEIEFTADEGTEYGNMYVYSGTYIGLPDETEE